MTNGLCGLRVLIADDHIAVRDSIKQLLLHAEINVVAEASDGIEAVRLGRQTMPDAAILDISMPQMNGIEATRELRRFDPCVCVILLTMHSADAYLHAGLRAGASGFVSKTEAFSRLLGAISTAISGRIHAVGKCIGN